MVYLGVLEKRDVVSIIGEGQSFDDNRLVGRHLEMDEFPCLAALNR